MTDMNSGIPGIPVTVYLIPKILPAFVIANIADMR